MFFTMFEPISYKTQVVAGTNWTIIYRISATQNIEVTAWEKLDGTTEITSVSEPYNVEVDTNAETGALLLKKFEDNAKNTMEGLLKKVRDNNTKNIEDPDSRRKYF